MQISVLVAHFSKIIYISKGCKRIADFTRVPIHYQSRVGILLSGTKGFSYISGWGVSGFIFSLWRIAIKNSTIAIRNMIDNADCRADVPPPPKYRSLVSIAMVRAANIPKAAET